MSLNVLPPSGKVVERSESEGGYSPYPRLCRVLPPEGEEILSHSKRFSLSIIVQSHRSHWGAFDKLRNTHRT